MAIASSAARPSSRTTESPCFARSPSRADQRGTGVGTSLVHAVEDLARETGATELILLTETAEPWFTRLGYTVIDRSTVPADVARSRSSS